MTAQALAVLDPEAAVLGCLLRLPADRAAAVAGQLRPSDFADPQHRLVLETVQVLAEAGTDPAPARVDAELRTTGRADRFRDGRAAGVVVLDLYAAAPAEAQVGYYLQRLQDEALRRAALAAGTRLVQLAEDPRRDPDDLLVAASQALADLLDDREAEPDQAGGGSSWQPVDLTPFVEGTHEAELPSLLRRNDGAALAYAGRVHWLSGEPETLKSWAALLLCLQVMQDGGRALYIDLEDSAAGITGRLLALGVPPAVLLDRFDYRSPSGPLTAAVQRDLAADVARASVVVIDAATESLAAQGLSSESDVDIARWLALLPRWAAKLGPAVFVLDHVVKNAETRGRWATGSQHKLAGLDGVAYTIETVDPGGRGLVGRSRLFVSKDRHGQVRGPHAVPATGGRFWLADLVVDATDGQPLELALLAPSKREGPFKPTGVMRKVSDALVSAGRPLNKGEIEARVGGRATVVRQAIAQLEDDGFLTVEAGSSNARVHHLVRPYVEAEADS